MTLGQLIEWLYDPAILPGRSPDEQAQWAALLLLQIRNRIGVA